MGGVDAVASLFDRPSSRIARVPFEASPRVLALPLVRAYIDETGDRGRLKGRASPIFGMAAVLVDDAAEAAARAAVRRLRVDFCVPDTRPMSCKDHLKTYERLVHASQVMAQVPGIQVVFVVADKSRLRANSYGDDVTLFYNVVAYATLQRMLWAAKRWQGGRRRIEVRFGHVAKHPDADTHSYFQIKKNHDGLTVPFELISHLSWVNASDFEMSQAADIYGGFLKAALWPDKFGNTEGSHLLRIWHQIRNSDNCVLSLGFQAKPTSEIVKSQHWWPCKDCASKY